MRTEVVIAILGLVGIVGPLVINKLLERRSLNRAILAEIGHLLITVEQHARWWSRPENRGFPLIPFAHPVYSKHVKNIGLLSGKYVGHAVKLYAYIDFLNALQAVQTKYPHEKIANFNGTYTQSLDAFSRRFKSAFELPLKKLNLP